MSPLEIPLTTYLDVLGIIKYDVSKSYGVKFILKVVLFFFALAFRCEVSTKLSTKTRKRKPKQHPQ